MRPLELAERLYIEADAHGEILRGRSWYQIVTRNLAKLLKGTGVGIKVGPALSSWGYGLLEEIREQGLPYWADLNLSGDEAKLALDAFLLFEYRPDIVTVSGMASLAAMRAVRTGLAGAEVIGNTSLEGFTHAEVTRRFSCDPIAATLQMAQSALDAGFDGWVATPDYTKVLRMHATGKTITVKNVRPAWSIGAGDDPGLVMTPERAFDLGADRIVVGMPIADAEDKHRAVMRTLDEIARVLDKIAKAQTKA